MSVVILGETPRQYSLHTSLDVIEEKTGAHFASSAADSNIKKTNTVGASSVVAPLKGEQVIFFPS